MTDAIRPHYAASLWVNNDVLFLELPNATNRIPEPDAGLIAHLAAFADRSEVPSAAQHLLRCAADRLEQLATRGQSHTLKLPNNTWGLMQVVNILKVRKDDSTIGTRGDMTQAQAEAEMKKLAKGIDPNMIQKPKIKIPITQEMRASARSILRRLGIS